MERRISLITLGVKDLKASRHFYVDMLGWQPMFETDGVIFFDVGGCFFALFPHTELAKDMGIVAGAVVNDRYHGFSLAYNTNSEAEIDEVFRELRGKNVKILKEPHRVFWGGYAGYFADPDDHAWEVAFNPAWTIAKDGRVIRK